MGFSAKLRRLPRGYLMVWAVLLVSLAGAGASLFGQYVLHMNPCVKCIEQRLALFAVALVSLLCLLLPLRRRAGRTAAAAIIRIPAAFGAWVAAEHIHLQSLPFAEQPDCGAPWSFRLRGWPLFDWYEPLIRGSGFCGEINRVLGVSLPVWSLMFFAAVLLAVWALWFAARND